MPTPIFRFLNEYVSEHSSIACIDRYTRPIPG
jgi:hypothetical protein